MKISEIDKQINQLRHQQSCLNKRQQELNDAIKQKQHLTNENLNERWQRTGSSKKQNEKDYELSFIVLDFPWSLKVNEICKEIFHINSFRPWQLETINVTLSGYDCILIMPTGGGKSLCYQLPAVISDGKIKDQCFEKKKNFKVFRNNHCYFTIDIFSRRSSLCSSKS